MLELTSEKEFKQTEELDNIEMMIAFYRSQWNLVIILQMICI